MAFMDFLLGTGAKTKTQPIYTPEQENLLDQLLAALKQGVPEGLQNLQNILGGDEKSFATFERPARRAFEQETLPTIAERFTTQFGTGSQRSSGYYSAVATAGRELEENLAAKRMGLQSDALSQLMELFGPAMSPRQHQYRVPRQPGFLEELAIAAAPAVGGAIVGGAPGAIAGGIKGLTGLLGGRREPLFSEEQEGLVRR